MKTTRKSSPRPTLTPEQKAEAEHQERGREKRDEQARHTAAAAVKRLAVARFDRLAARLKDDLGIDVAEALHTAALEGNAAYPANPEAAAYHCATRFIQRAGLVPAPADFALDAAPAAAPAVPLPTSKDE